MTFRSQIEAIEARLAARGLTVKALCGEAGVNQSTWTRWKAGDNQPNFATWSRVLNAADRLVPEQQTGAA